MWSILLCWRHHVAIIGNCSTAIFNRCMSLKQTRMSACFSNVLYNAMDMSPTLEKVYIINVTRVFCVFWGRMLAELPARVARWLLGLDCGGTLIRDYCSKKGFSLFFRNGRSTSSQLIALRYVMSLYSQTTYKIGLRWLNWTSYQFSLWGLCLENHWHRY